MYVAREVTYIALIRSSHGARFPENGEFEYLNLSLRSNARYILYTILYT